MDVHNDLSVDVIQDQDPLSLVIASINHQQCVKHYLLPIDIDKYNKHS